MLCKDHLGKIEIVNLLLKVVHVIISENSSRTHFKNEEIQLSKLLVFSLCFEYIH